MRHGGQWGLTIDMRLEVFKVNEDKYSLDLAGIDFDTEEYNKRVDLYNETIDITNEAEDNVARAAQSVTKEIMDKLNFQGYEFETIGACD